MAQKGLIHRLESKGIARYCKAPLVVGIYEAQVDRLTPELEREVREYFAEQFGRAVHTTKVPQMRTVPVNQSIQVERAVANYTDIRAFVEKSAGPFAMQNCICRQGKDLTGEPCRQTHERRNCLLIGGAAEAMVGKGAAVEITREKMLDMLAAADREGLVLQPQNTLDPMFVCCCCGCCCGVLTTAKKLDRPAEFFATEYVAEVDTEVCSMCGECVERCQMEALAMDGEPVQLAAERCIGCGLCVTTCPTGGIRLKRLEGRTPPPKDTTALYTKMFLDRFGKWKAATAIAGHFVGRKF